MKRKNLLAMLRCLLVFSLVLLPSLNYARPVVASPLATTASTLSSVQQEVQTVTSNVYASQSQGSTNSVFASVYSAVYNAVSSKQFSVKSFGAVGNGRHDDTAAIQSAINYVANVPGGVAFFPQGTYLISHYITVPSNASLQGVGANSIIMGSVSMGTTTMFLMDNSKSAQNNIRIDNLTFNGVSNLPGFPGLQAIQIGGGQYDSTTLPSYGFDNVSVTNCLFTNCRIAVRTTNILASGAVQSNLTLSNNQAYNISRFVFGEIANTNNVMISGNTFSNTGFDHSVQSTPVWDPIYVQNGSNITITHNNISNYGDSGIEVGHYPYTNNVPAPSDINITDNSIEQSTSSDGILITTASNVNISNNTLKDVNQWGIHVRDSSYAGDKIPTTKVTIQNNIIEYTTTYDGIAIDLNNYGAVPDNNIIISDNTISNIARTGITINNNQNTTNNEYTISNNKLNSCGANFINTFSGGGAITGNVCNGAHQDGIYTGPGVENMTINNNKVYAYGISQSNRYHGILAQDAANSEVSSNTIDSQANIAHVGISVSNAFSTSLKVIDNTISHAFIPIYSTSPLNVISNNQISPSST